MSQSAFTQYLRQLTLCGHIKVSLKFAIYLIEFMSIDFVVVNCLSKLSLLFLRQSRQTVPDVNTEPSQNEQIIWDDPTAREERARLASSLQWPSCPTQYSELQVDIKKLEDSPSQEALRDSEIAKQGNEKKSIHLFV